MSSSISPEDPEAILRLTSALDAGDLAVVPFGFSYAVVADALNEDAVERAFLATARPADKPMPVCVGGFEDVGHVATATPLGRALADAFWPGPLTIVLRAKPWLPDPLTAGGETVGVRAPEEAFARSLASHFGPLAVARARRHGSGASTDVASARAALGAEIQWYVDAGARPGGESSVVDATGSEARVLREGAIGAPEIVAHGRRPD